METAVTIIGLTLIAAVVVYVVWTLVDTKKDDKTYSEAPKDNTVLSQNVGIARVSNRDVKAGIGATLGRYVADFILDATDEASDGGKAVVNVKVVSGEQTPLACIFDQTYKVSMAKGESGVIGSCDAVIDLTKGGWKVVMNMNGKVYEYALRVPAIK